MSVLHISRRLTTNNPIFCNNWLAKNGALSKNSSALTFAKISTCMAQYSFPDIEQMALFDEGLDDRLPNRGLSDALDSGNVSELGDLLRQLDYKALRIELNHCEYTIPEHCESKSALIQHFWSDWMKTIKSKR